MGSKLVINFKVLSLFHALFASNLPPFLLSLNSLSLEELDTRRCLVCHIFQHVINPIIFNNNCKKKRGGEKEI